MIGHGVGDGLGVRPIDRLRRETRLGQSEQFAVRATRIQTSMCIGLIAVRGLAADPRRGSADIGRLTGEDLAKDRAEAEDVGSAIAKTATSPLACSGGM